MSKTETTQTAKTDSIPNPFASFDAMATWTAAQQAFQNMLTEAHSRATAMSAEYAGVEAQLVARAQAAVASWAQLAQDAIAYTAQLSAQARKLGIETARKMGAQS
jgi:hypothetical protein